MSVTLLQSCDTAIDYFGIESGNPPRLVKTGILAVDNEIGGIYPGSCGILGMDQGTGKTSIVMHSAISSASKIGVVSTEDGPDVWGSRVLSAYSGVDSMKIRIGDLTSEERVKLLSARSKVAELQSRIVYKISPYPEEIEEATSELGEEGCELVWLDYLQKIRGGSDDRRNEISRAYTSFQRACSEYRMAGMAVSQFSRRDPNKEPRTWCLKESGDLENEARVILLGWRDSMDTSLVNVRLAKSTYGGEGLLFHFVRDESGTLRESARDNSGDNNAW